MARNNEGPLHPDEQRELDAAIAESAAFHGQSSSPHDNYRDYGREYPAPGKRVNPWTGAQWRITDPNLPESYRNMNHPFWNQFDPLPPPRREPQIIDYTPYVTPGTSVQQQQRQQQQVGLGTPQPQVSIQHLQDPGQQPSRGPLDPLRTFPGAQIATPQPPTPPTFQQIGPQPHPHLATIGDPFAILGFNRRQRDPQSIDSLEQQALRHRPENETGPRAFYWPTRQHIILAAQYLRGNWDEANARWQFHQNGAVWRPGLMPGRRGVFPLPHARTWDEIDYARSRVSSGRDEFGRWTSSSEHPRAPLRATWQPQEGPGPSRINGPEGPNPYGLPEYDGTGMLIWPQEWRTFIENHHYASHTGPYAAAIAGPHNGISPMYEETPLQWIRRTLDELRGMAAERRMEHFHAITGTHLSPDWAEFFGRDLGFVDEPIWIFILGEIATGRGTEGAIHKYNAIQAGRQAERAPQVDKVAQAPPAGKAGPGLGQRTQPARGTGDFQQPTQIGRSIAPSSYAVENDPDDLYGATPPGSPQRPRTQPGQTADDTPMGGMDVGDGGDPSNDESSGDDDDGESSKGKKRKRGGGPAQKEKDKDLADSPNLWGRYDDDGPLEPWETREYYYTRIHRARHNMQIQRRPAHPAGFFSTPRMVGGLSAVLKEVRRREDEHRNSLANDPEYKFKWENARAARRAQNSQRRQEAFEHKNKEYIKRDLRPLESQPDPPEDSDHDEYYDRQVDQIRPSTNMDQYKDFEERGREPFRCVPCKKGNRGCTYKFERFPCGPCRKLGITDECVSINDEDECRKSFEKSNQSLGAVHFHKRGPFIPSYASERFGIVGPAPRMKKSFDDADQDADEDTDEDDKQLPSKRRAGVKGRRGGNKPVHRCFRCREKHQKCNGKRPCNNCKSKSQCKYADEEDDNQPREGSRCARCRLWKKGCDRKRPCDRCRKAKVADQCATEDEEEDDVDDDLAKQNERAKGNEAPGARKALSPTPCVNCQGTTYERRCFPYGKPCVPCRERKLEVTCNFGMYGKPYPKIPYQTQKEAPDDPMDLDDDDESSSDGYIHLPGDNPIEEFNITPDRTLPWRGPPNGSEEVLTHDYERSPSRSGQGRLPTIRETLSVRDWLRDGSTSGFNRLEELTRWWNDRMTAQIVTNRTNHRSNDAANDTAEAIAANDQVNHYDPPEAPPYRPRLSPQQHPDFESLFPQHQPHFESPFDNDPVVDRPHDVSQSATPGLKLPLAPPRWSNRDLPLATELADQLDLSNICREKAGKQFWESIRIRNTTYAWFDSSFLQEEMTWAEKGPNPELGEKRPDDLCGTVPAKDCDHVLDAWMSSCQDCRTDQIARMRTIHGEDEMIEESKKWFCQNCSAEIKERRYAREVPANLRIGDRCDCISQLQNPWLCNAHRLGAKCDIAARLNTNVRWDRVCPGCRYADLALGEKYDTWECQSCFSVVQLP